MTSPPFNHSFVHVILVRALKKVNAKGMRFESLLRGRKGPNRGNYWEKPNSSGNISPVTDHQ